MQSVYLDDRITFVCSCLLRENTVSGHFQGKPFAEIVNDENSWIIFVKSSILVFWHGFEY